MKKKMIRFGKLILCLLILFIVIGPILLSLVNSFKSEKEITRNYFSLPSSITFENYERAIVKRGYFSYLLNSVMFTVASAVLCGIINTFVSFMIVENLNKPFYRFSYYALSCCMFIPVNIIFFPLIKMYYAWNLMNVAGLLLYNMACMIPECTFLLVPLLKGRNPNLKEAAALDGCSFLQYYYKVFIPAHAVEYGTVIIISFIWMWNAFLLPLMILNSKPEAWTLPIFLYNFLGKTSATKGPAFASNMLTLVPALFLCVLFNKRARNSGV